MRIGNFACAALAACMTLALPGAGVEAGDIYRWTDAEGTVHYGDRPTGAATEERLAIRSARTDPQRVRSMVEARQAARAAAAVEGQPGSQPSAEDERAAAAERAKKCTEARERLQRFLTSRRLYRHDENGERVYLDEEETEAARARSQEQVVEYCGS